MTAPTSRRLVLVVDTDASFAEDTRQLLAGERVLSARSVQEAAEIVVGARVDLALLGPSFDNEARVTSAALLREADPGLMAVLAANIVTNRILLAALRAGMSDVIDMPLTARKLAGLLDRVPVRREPPGTVVLEDASAPSAPASEPVASAEDPSDPVTITFQAASSLSSKVTFTEADDLTEPAAGPADSVLPPAGEPAIDAWSIPVETAEPGLPDTPPSAAVEHPAPSPAPAVPDTVRPTDQVVPQPPVDARPSEPPVPPPAASPAWEPPVAPPPPSSPPPSAPLVGDLAVADSWKGTPPPSFEPARRAPVDLERVGLLPADGRRRELPAGSGHVVAVMAGKGGSGKTITATNLAMALNLQRGEDTVVVVDADLQFGDVALLLQLDPTRTLADAVARIDELSDARLDGLLLRHESGLRVLAAPLHPAAEGAVPAKAIVEVIERLRGMYEVVIVDTPPIFDDHLVTVLEGADEVLVVVDMDLPSVKNAKIALDALRSGRFPMERMRLVVNRANAKARLDLVELERSLGVRVAGSIPSDRLVPKSVTEGVPVVALSPRSRVARSFHALAGLLDLPQERAPIGSPRGRRA